MKTAIAVRLGLATAAEGALGGRVVLVLASMLIVLVAVVLVAVLVVVVEAKSVPLVALEARSVKVFWTGRVLDVEMETEAKAEGSPTCRSWSRRRFVSPLLLLLLLLTLLPSLCLWISVFSCWNPRVVGVLAGSGLGRGIRRAGSGRVGVAFCSWAWFAKAAV